MATHSSILVWRNPWTEKPGGLYSPWGCEESDTSERLSTSQNTGKEEMPWSLVPGVGEHVGGVQTFSMPAPVGGPFPRLWHHGKGTASGIMEKELSIPPAGRPASDRNVSKEPEVLRREGIE